MIMRDIPYPPMRLRKSVGPVEDIYYDNPGGQLVFETDIPARNYQRIFDFGCGCGRVARQLMLQRQAPVESYMGIDLFKESIDWASKNLSSVNAAFQFRHHDVYNAQFNPKTNRESAPFPADDKSFSLVTAHSVFTHVLERNFQFYLSECRRILMDDGIFRSSWFLIPVVHAAIAMPFVIRAALPVVQGIPRELRSAAATLGASPWRRFCLVEIPLLRPAITTGIAFSMAISLGEFGATSFLTRRESQTLPIIIANLFGKVGAIPRASGMAASLLLVIVTGIIVLSVDRKPHV